MASRLDLRKAGIGLATVAASALLWWFGSNLHPVWWLTWLAPLPVLWLAPRTGRWPASLAAFVAYAAGGFNQWQYLHGYIGLPLPVILSVIALPALAFALTVLLYRRLVLCGRPLAAALVVPALWVAVEYLNSLYSPHGTFGAIAYTQADALPVIQLAAITGIWGIGFLLLLLPATLAVQTAVNTPRRGRVLAAVVTAVALTLSLGYGAWRLQVPPVGTLRIGLVSLEKPIRPALADADGQALLARYEQTVERLAAQGARAVVIPETAFATADRSIPAFAALAQRYDLRLDVGIDFKGDPAGERNMAMTFLPDASAPATYSKRHLIPGFENQYTPGDGFRMLGGTPRIGLAICKDMDFHDIGRAYAARDTQLLLVPAWDFSIDGWLHSRMAILRGVESGFALARAARSGRLTLSDDRGRVVAEASSEQHDAELVGDLPLHDSHTLYGRWGDYFAWIDLAALAWLLVLAFLPTRRSAV